MNLLFITPYLPSENSGHAGAQLIFRNVKYLSKKHKIQIVSFISSKETEHLPELKNLGIKIVLVKYNRNQSGLLGIILGIVNNFKAILKSMFGRESFFTAKYNRRSMKKTLIKINENFQPDIVQFEYNVMHHYVYLFPSIPKILMQHDILTKVYERSYKNAKKWIQRLKIKKIYKIMEKQEHLWMRKFNRIITLTDEDKKYCIDNWIDLPPIDVVPPQIYINNVPKKKNKQELCFVGSFNREPNIVAVDILLEKIVPGIQKQVPELKLKIAGKYLPKYLQNKIRTMINVQYFGFVEDIDSFIGEAILFLAPITIGAGLKMKNTHALACGTAVCTTTVGAEGIPFSPKEGLWIEDSIDKTISLCIDLLKRPDELIRAGKRGKKVVQEYYSPRKIVGKLQHIYDNLANK